MACLISFPNFILAFCFVFVLAKQHDKTPPELMVLSSPIYLGEGPHWDVQSQSLYFVDLLGQRILRYDFQTGIITSAYMSHGPVGVVIPVQDQPGTLLVACSQDVLLVNWDGLHNVTDPPYKKLVTLEQPWQGTRVNDGKCDRRGRFWIGTMAYKKPDGTVPPYKGTLYSFDSQAGLQKRLHHTSISNGLAWNSRDDIMYYIDSSTNKIVSFDYDIENGNLSNRKVIFDLPKHNISGIPDGMTIDTNDNLWVANHDGYAVLNIDPRNGKLLRKLDFPARRVTSVAFGGPNLDILFVTSTYEGISDSERNEYPYNGCLFDVKDLGVKGYPANNFILNNNELE